MNPPDSSPSNAERATAAWAEIVAFLAGRHADVHRMTEAVQSLRQTRPDKLLRLRAALQDTEKSVDKEECREVLECLEDYLARGPERAAAMATVEHHLASCRACAKHLAVLQDLMPSRPQETRSATNAGAPSLLRLVAREWWLIRPDGASPLRDAREAVAFRQPVGRFRLRDLRQEEQVLALAMPEASPQVPLSLQVGGGAAEVDLLVLPEHRYGATPPRPGESRDVWILRFTLAGTSLASRLEVGVGREEGQTTGMQTISAGHKAEFELEPPRAHAYWAYFEWRGPEGELKTDKVELPLRSGPEGSTGR